MTLPNTDCPTNYLLSIDAGLSTGVALLGYDENDSWLEASWQFGGGVGGFLKWYWSHVEDNHYRTGWTLPGLEVGFFDDEAPLVIAEKFNARSTSGFAYTTASLEPLRVEGAMIAEGLMPAGDDKRWRAPVLQYVVGGKDKADKKKRLHAMLKATGFYIAPKDLGTSDADDVRSAIGHGLAYLTRQLRHKPTFDKISDWIEKNGR